MYIVQHIFLAACVFISCVFSLYWQGIRKKQIFILSAVSGLVCGLTICLHQDIQYNILISMVFIVLYLSVVLFQPEVSWMDVVAADTLACAGFGALQTGIIVLLEIKEISSTFRVVLAVFYLLVICVFFKMSASYFPGKQWKEYLSEDASILDIKIDSQRAFCGLMILYSVCCAIPAVTGTFSVAVLGSEFGCFWAGLFLLNLIIINQKKTVTLDSERQSRENMQMYMSVIRSQRHDYNFHVQTLQGLLQKKAYTECEKYVKELLCDSVEMNNILPLEDAAISALILSFKNRAKTKGIFMEISVENSLSNVATNVYETNKIIGNLLQNALDETEQLKDKSYGIRLNILKRGEYCVINVSNKTQSDNPLEAYQPGKSTKNGHEGIGIASVRAILERCGGVLYAKKEENIVFFIAKIPIVLTEREYQ